MRRLRFGLFTVIFVLFGFTLSYPAVAAEWVSLNGATAMEPRVTVLSSDDSMTLLQVDLPGFFVEEVMVNGEKFQKLSFFSSATTNEIGLPALPLVGELVGIPNRSGVSVSLQSRETILLDGYHVYPFQEPVLEGRPDPLFTLDKNAYTRDSWYPEQVVETDKPGVLRGVKVAPVRMVPFRYNPADGELEVSLRMIVRIDYTGAGDGVSPSAVDLSVSPRLDRLYRSMIINYDDLNLPMADFTDDFQVKYLIICPDAESASIIQPLADFRNAQGYGVEVRTMEPGFQTADDFRSYIHDLYVSDGLEYVLLVGDYCPATGNTVMPMYYWVDSWSDSWYSMVDPWPNNGTDYYADLAVGRFVYDTNAELQHQVDKTMGYLTSPSTADNWAEHSLLVAHEEEFPLKYTYCSEEIRTFPYALQTPIFQQGYGGAGYTNADVVNYLNNTGSGILNYRGHGSQTAWWQWGPTGDFNATNINQLTNEDKLFVHFDVCCDNMDFPGYSGNSFAESFMKAEFGCVAIHSAIIPSYTIPNHDYDKEFYKAIFNEGINNIGFATNFANVTVYNEHGSLGESNIRTYLWLGDAAIDPWTKTPQQLVVTHLPVVNIGTSTLDVTVSMAGLPVENAMVCAQNTETYTVAYTDAAGMVTLDFGTALTQPGTLGLTVTTHNGLPYQSEIDVVPAEGPYVVAVNAEIVDAGGWLANGALDYDETSLLTIPMQNVGIETASGVTVTITTNDPQLTISDGTESYGDIAPDETVTIAEGFAVTAAGDISDGHIFLIDVEATAGASSWQSVVALVGHAPDLTPDHLAFNDPTGNNNGWLDPGETADMEVFITNDGSSPCVNLGGLLSSLSPYLTIDETNGDFGIIPAGTTGSATFQVTAAQNTPQETVANAELQFSGDHNFSADIPFQVMIGNHLYDPTGPDSYGYSAYDPFDAPETPQFDWVEISADSGGPGTRIEYQQDDSCAVYTLPFSFRYYGADYDFLTVATNGWLAMGTVTVEDYSNSSIPNTDGPPAMIAPYWEDLSPQRAGSGGVWRWYDENNHRYIVEYNHIEQYSPTGAFETFQVILFDPVYYPTTTGDGRILFQYKEMSASSQVEGTIGIENATETVGLQYFFDGAFDTNAHTISDGFAVLFSTPAAEEPALSVTLTPDNPPVVIPAEGGTFSYTLEITNNSGSQVVFDAWILAVLPNGNPYPLLSRTGIALPGGGVISRPMTQDVPGGAPSGEYAYRCNVGDYPATVTASDEFTFTKEGVTVGQGDGEWSLFGWEEDTPVTAVEIPNNCFLAQNSPNPFNPVTTVTFGITDPGMVKLTVYNIAGRQVALLQNGRMAAGVHSITFNGSGLASGVYFYRLEAESFSALKKMVLLK